MDNPHQVAVPACAAPPLRGKQKKECVNRKLIPPKILLITVYGALGCIMPFLTLHMKYLGLTHEEITWINTVLPITSLIGSPVAGYVADRTGRHKTVTIVAMLLAAVFHTLLLFVPPTHRTGPHPPPLQLWCGPSGSHLSVLPCQKHQVAMEGLTNPCDIYEGSVPSAATFSLSNCRYHCGNSSTAFLFDAPPSPSSPPPVPGEAFFELPSIEHSVPSTAPHVCLVDASKTKNCFHIAHDNSSFTFSRTLVLDNAQPFSSGDGRKTCRFPQEELSTATGGYYDNIVCDTEERCSVVCDATEETNGTRFLQGEQCRSVEGNPRLTFWVYFVLRSTADLFPPTLISLLDAMVLTMVNQYDGDFGRQKMFGLVAVGMTAPLVGWLMDGHVASYGNLRYGPVFYVFSALMCVSAVLTICLPFRMEIRTHSLFRSLSLLFRNAELVTLFLIMSVLGSFFSYLETFLYIHLETLNAPKLLIGLTITIGIVPSIPFLFKSEPIVKYCGHHHLLMIAFVMYCIRFIGFAHMRNPWWCMPLEALELFTLNMLQVTAATLAFKLAPKSLVATVQALVFSAHFTIGQSVGALASGMLIDAYGMKNVFVGASVLSGSLAIIYFTVYYCLRWRRKTKGRTSAIEGQGKATDNTQQLQQNVNGSVANGTYRPIPLDDRI